MRLLRFPLFVAGCMLLATIPDVMAQDILWVRQHGSAGTENLTGVSRNANGHVYSSGEFTGTVDFDPGAGTFDLTATGSKDVFVSRLDPDGTFVWAGRFGGTGSTAIGSTGSVAIDPNGNAYVVGAFSGTTDFDPGVGVLELTSAGSAHGFVVKLDPDGNLVWARRVGGSAGLVWPLTVAADAAGVAFGGYFSSTTVDFDPGAGTRTLPIVGADDAFVARLDAAGNFVFAVPFGSPTADITHGMRMRDGAVYATGRMALSIDFDPGPGVNTLSGSVFVVRIDGSGGVSLARAFGPTGAQARAFDMALDSDGNIYTAGFFSNGAVDFDPGPDIYTLTSLGSNASSDGFVSKLDSAGNFVWARAVAAGTSNDIAAAIEVGVDGRVHVVGRFAGTADFDPGAGASMITAAGGSDIYVSEFDTDGGFIGVLGMGGTLNELPTDVTLDHVGSLVVAGIFRDVIDFDPGAGTASLTSQGGDDAFVWKYGLASLSVSGGADASLWFCPAAAAMAFDVVRGSISDLRATAGYADATCLGIFTANPAMDDAVPAVGDGFYYITRGRACCTSGGYGHSSLTPDPRQELSNLSLCP